MMIMRRRRRRVAVVLNFFKRALIEIVSCDLTPRMPEKGLSLCKKSNAVSTIR